jgi:CHAT domain-containing protein/tetratricopeptide (TPR) repeat protein
MEYDLTPQFDCLNQEVFLTVAISDVAIHEARDICERHLENPEALGRLATWLCAAWDYAAVEPVVRRLEEVTRSALGENHPDHARSLHGLAGLYHRMGQYAQAEPLYRRALGIRRNHFGEDHPEVIGNLSDLAALYCAMGDYKTAESFLELSLRHNPLATSTGRTPSRNILRYATDLERLGTLFQLTGCPTAAKPLYRKAWKARCSVLEEWDRDRAGHLFKRATLHHQLGELRRAARLYQRALKLEVANYAAAERLHRRGSPRFADGLNNFALLRIRQGNYAAAERLLRLALRQQRRNPDKELPTYVAPPWRENHGIAPYWRPHPDRAATLHNLASVYYKTGRFEAAERCARRAVRLQHEILGEWHPYLAVSLTTLACLLAATGRAEDALPLMLRAAEIDDRLLGQVFSTGSEARRANIIQKVRGRFGKALTLVVTLTPRATSAALDLVLRRKAVLAEALATQRIAVLAGRYPALEGKLRALLALGSQITQKTLAGPAASSSWERWEQAVKAHRQKLKRWSTERDALEAELARQIPEMDLRLRLSSATHEAVSRALPEGAALVEFVRYSPVNFTAVPASGEDRALPPRYLAFVLPAGDPDGARLLDLGDAGVIDQLVADFRERVTRHSEPRDEREPGRECAAEEVAGERLRSLAFDPLVEALRGRRRLVLSPDGDLNGLPFQALPLRGGRLIDEYRISYVSVGRDVLSFQSATGCSPAAPLVAADPNFDLGACLEAPARAAGASGPLSDELRQGQCRFRRLPGAQVEGERVARSLGVEPLLADDSLEGRLKACRSPRVLHLATHGFFLPDRKPERDDHTRNLELLGPGWASLPGRLSGPGMEDPMLRSGLVLAGANTFLKGGTPPEEAEDGLLTAADVAGLDLLGTELVVLSACETGLGAVHVGEGVFGLRRAFSVAGAKTLVMSLWKVPDLATAFLMDRLYDNLLARGLDRDLALHDAQRATRDVTVAELQAEWLSGTMIERLAAGDAEARRVLEELARQPDGHRPFEHPFYWGAFICHGDTAPLPGMDPGPG